MKSIIVVTAVFLALVAFVACNKGSNDPEKPRFITRGVQGLRPPTCNDSTDDGKFEQYNDSERINFLNVYTIDPGVEDASFVDDLFLKPTFSLSKDGASYQFVYQCLKPVWATVRIVSPDTSFHLFFSTSDHLTGYHNIGIGYSLMNFVKTTGGCYRLYYIFSELQPDKTNSWDYYRIVNKGHFDFTVAP